MFFASSTASQWRAVSVDSDSVQFVDFARLERSGVHRGADPGNARVL